MAEAPDRTTVAGTGVLYFAPYGTTLPTDVDDTPDPAFIDVGITTDEGATFNDGSSAGDPVHGWGRTAPYRITDGNAAPVMTTALKEWSEDNFVLAFGGGSVVSTLNGHKYSPPRGVRATFSILLEMTDGANKWLLVVPKCKIVEATEVAFMRTGGSELPLAAAMMVPDDGGDEWYPLLTHPGFTLA